MFTIRKHGRPWAVLGATALIVAAGGLTVSAAAAPPNLPPPGYQGTLTIHKLQAPEGVPGNGTPPSPSPTNRPILGVEFTIQQIDVDLSTIAGWGRAADLDPETALDHLVVGSTKTSTTQVPDGTILFEPVNLGLYLVTETDASKAWIDFNSNGTQDPGEAVAAVPSAPFLVTIPVVDPITKATWVKDVHVYPKNDAFSSIKFVDDGNAHGLGDPVNWTILADIPVEADEITAYSISDMLDSRLTFKSADVDLSFGPSTDMNAEEQSTYELDDLVEGVNADYTITRDVDTNTVTVTLTANGIDKIQAFRKAQGTSAHIHVRVVLATTINSVGTDGIINNTAKTTVTEVDSETQKPSTVDAKSNTVTTKWGGAKFLKVADSSETSTVEAEPLSGAEFEVWTAPVTTPVLDENGDPTTDEDGQPIVKVTPSVKVSINGKSSWVSGVDGTTPGTFTIDGLKVGSYLLKEIKAPDGYELLTGDGVPFTISGPVNPAATTYAATITNVAEHPEFTLPLTGGTGTTMLTVGGVLVLAAAGVLVLRSRRNTSDAGL